MPENPPKKAKKSKKLTITEKNPPKKPPHISEKVPLRRIAFLFARAPLLGWSDCGKIKSADGGNLTVSQLGALALVPAL